MFCSVEILEILESGSPYPPSSGKKRREAQAIPRYFLLRVSVLLFPAGSQKCEMVYGRHIKSHSGST
jgi:hypothetical protein